MNFVDPLPGVMRAAMNRIVELPHEMQDKIAREDGYELRVHGRVFDLVAAFEELEHLLELIQRAKTFQEISLLIKVYIIGWVALSDIFANVVNEVFDLGYAEQDIQFGVIMRNRNIRNSPLNEVIKRHGKLIRYDDLNRRRNDIVHRGKLDDAELMDVRGEVLSAVVMKTMRVNVSDPAAVAAATREASLEVDAAGKMRDLLGVKREQFVDHLRATRNMFGEVAPLLIQRISSQARATA